MPTSITILLAALGFIAFGYLSLVRSISKHSFAAHDGKVTVAGFFGGKLLRNLGSSAFFVSLPATSLLLFWGWGPAVMWLLAFHLLIESLCHLQYSAQSTELGVADHLLRAQKPLHAGIEQGLIQAFFLVSMAVVTALMATLIDRQSGLLFAILFLLPARALWRHPSTSFPTIARIVSGLVLLGMGLAMSDRLGFSIYGDWAPFGDTLSWLRFNNPTVIAAVLIVAILQLEQNQGFKQDLSSLAGLIICLLVIIVCVTIVWQAPLLDAPMNSAQVRSEGLPLFVSISLFVFAGFSALLIRLLIEEENSTAHSKQQFYRLQFGSFIHLAFLILLILSLAAAIGIGAWKTHYIEWTASLNILDQLNLSITTILNLVHDQAETGSVMHTLLLAALCFTGFSFMLMCADQLSLEEREPATLTSLVLEAKIPQAILIFIATAYFIAHGISLQVWLLIGMLGWVLFTHLMLGMTLSQAPSGRRKIYAGVCGLLIVTGYIQACLVILYWALAGQIVFVGCALVILICTTLLWPSAIRELLTAFQSAPEEQLF
ncbi:hypothetical protein GCM10008090_15350 [Arenicella chitinivorans]|uniref:Uncharacterized protein n=1 Tax=Arenicella chitinivorans TaxID=1329800 RepID=A0A918RQG5_9GAMM|nr:hypothetical protein [Arenicella chitinivorans]GHA06611.1 hypothetical protein GCM10008090_15350 [Arenicella chitinivorans]